MPFFSPSRLWKARAAADWENRLSENIGGSGYISDWEHKQTERITSSDRLNLDGGATKGIVSPHRGSDVVSCYVFASLLSDRILRSFFFCVLRDSRLGTNTKSHPALLCNRKPEKKADGALTFKPGRCGAPSAIRVVNRTLDVGQIWVEAHALRSAGLKKREISNTSSKVCVCVCVTAPLSKNANYTSSYITYIPSHIPLDWPPSSKSLGSLTTLEAPPFIIRIDFHSTDVN